MLVSTITLVGLLLVGLTAGLSAGLFGLGGGIVLVPALLSVLGCLDTPDDIKMKVAVATSLVLLVLTATSASIGHYRKRNLDPAICLRWIPGVCLGSLLGAWLLPMAPTLWLKMAFMLYLGLCIVYGCLERNAAGKITNDTLCLRQLAIPSVVIGCCSTLLGIGGGAFTTPLLNFLRYPFRKALAVSSLTGIAVGAVATMTLISDTSPASHPAPYSLGYINGLAFIIIAPTSIVGSALGVRLATNLNPSLLKKAYTGFLTLVLLLMLYHVAI